MSSSSTMVLRQVGQVLLEGELISEVQLEKALEAQKKSPARKLLGEVIVELGYCTQLQVVKALANAYDVPFANLNPRLVDPNVAISLPRDFIKQHNVLPLFLVDGVLTLAMAELSNLFVVEEVEAMTGYSVQIVAARKADILATAEAAFQARPTDQAAIEDILAQARESTDLSAHEDIDAEALDRQSASSPVVKLVNQLMVSAVRENASDIHVETGHKSLRVRFRVDGRLYEKMKPPHEMGAAFVSRIKILAGLDIAERRLPQDGSIRTTVDEREIDLRVSTLPSQFGEKVVLRILDTQRALIDLDQLGMEPELRASFEAAVGKPHGLILVTGPTGSGKTTTLYSGLKLLVSPEVNISTVEDPIEYSLPDVNQFQVNERIGLDFPVMLRAMLRQDPDVIMVGEIRDPDTARIAVQAAMTGHLVLSTMHTNDAAGAISRLMNLGVEPYLISASLEAVLAQRLVRRICPNCKVPAPKTKHLASALAHVGRVGAEVFEGRGCTQCHQIGAKGRVGLFEFMMITDEIRDVISSGAPTNRLRDLAQHGGMRSLRDSGIEKALSGQITVEEMLRVTAGEGVAS